MIPWILFSLGTGCFLTGLLYRNHSFEMWDNVQFTDIYAVYHKKPWRRLFRLLWPLGTTPVALVALLLLIYFEPHAGVIALIIYLLTALVERAAKLSLKRPRPFQKLPQVVNFQPRKPRDPSFPSGDVFRVVFLGIVLPFSLGLPPLSYLFSAIIALGVSLGRIALGVHYPLDVISGAGLGLMASAFHILIL